MFLHKKALYNLFQYQLQQPEQPLQPWQEVDYREIQTETLLSDLQKLAIPLETLHHFEEIANRFESPEEMAESLAKQKEPLEQDHSFLLIFELWRRHLPDKRTVSTFCDELDLQINRYRQDIYDQEIIDIIEYLKQILDDNADAGYDPLDVMSTMQSFCGNNIEEFLYDYTLDQVEQREIDYSAELLEAFYPYVHNPDWFDYLVARLEMVVDDAIGLKRLKKVLQLENKEIVLEALAFLADAPHLVFPELAAKALDTLNKEELFLPFLSCCAHYYQQVDQAKSQQVEAILTKRKERKFEQTLDKKDPDLLDIKQILKHS